MLIISRTGLAAAILSLSCLVLEVVMEGFAGRLKIMERYKYCITSRCDEWKREAIAVAQTLLYWLLWRAESLVERFQW